MRCFQEQGATAFKRTTMGAADVEWFIRRMLVVRHGQEKLLAAVQNLADKDVVPWAMLADGRSIDLDQASGYHHAIAVSLPQEPLLQGGP